MQFSEILFLTFNILLITIGACELVETGKLYYQKPDYCTLPHAAFQPLRFINYTIPWILQPQECKTYMYHSFVGVCYTNTFVYLREYIVSVLFLGHFFFALFISFVTVEHSRTVCRCDLLTFVCNIVLYPYPVIVLPIYKSVYTLCWLWKVQ